MEVNYFHVNPPKERGSKRTYKSRASFAGVIQNGILQIGMSFCHTKDQFCRKTGRTKATGIAVVNPQWKYDLPETIEKKTIVDFFVQKCREQCDILVMNHDYERRPRGRRKTKAATFAITV